MVGWHWVLGVYPADVVADLMVSLLQRGTFFKRRGAEPQKGPAKRACPTIRALFPQFDIQFASDLKGRSKTL
jgi:hypothetical protein